jgi:hypothetical protein
MAAPGGMVPALGYLREPGPPAGLVLGRFGWRWETVDTAKRRGWAAFQTSGDRTTLGPTMASFPDGGWSSPATCWMEPMRSPRRHPGEDPPVASCTCGYRVCRDIKTAYEYMFPTPGVLRRECQTNPFGLVLVHVETRGNVLANDGGANLGAHNCVNAYQIRPVWPALVVDENVRDMMREHYGRDDIECLNDWNEAVSFIGS